MPARINIQTATLKCFRVKINPKSLLWCHQGVKVARGGTDTHILDFWARLTCGQRHASAPSRQRKRRGKQWTRDGWTGTEPFRTLRWRQTLQRSVRKTNRSLPTELLRHQELWLIHVIYEIRKALCGKRVRPSVIYYQRWMIARSRVDVNGIVTLLRCYAALIDSYRRFGITCRSLLQMFSNPRRLLLFEDGTDWFPKIW